jgi:hypothetical protein
VGAISVAGDPVGPAAQGRSTTSLWVDGVVALRAELRTFQALWIQATTELSVPFVRYRFAFDNPDMPVYQVPIAAGAAFVGLALRFP